MLDILCHTIAEQVGAALDSCPGAHSSADEVIALHLAIMGLAGAGSGAVVRDWQFLEPALYRPRMAARYGAADPIRRAVPLLGGLGRTIRSTMGINSRG